MENVHSKMVPWKSISKLEKKSLPVALAEEGVGVAALAEESTGMAVSGVGVRSRSSMTERRDGHFVFSWMAARGKERTRSVRFLSFTCN